MIYAFILLSAVAVFTWSIWGGMNVPAVDTEIIRARISESYHRTKDRLTGAVKNEIREELHEVVDEKLQ